MFREPWTRVSWGLWSPAVSELPNAEVAPLPLSEVVPVSLLMASAGEAAAAEAPTTEAATAAAATIFLITVFPFLFPPIDLIDATGSTGFGGLGSGASPVRREPSFALPRALRHEGDTAEPPPPGPC